MKTRIEELELEIIELGKQIGPLATRRSERKLELLTLKSPFKPGDIIAWGNKKGRVIQIQAWVGKEPEWVVTIIRKDGSDGSRSVVHPYFNPVLVQN